MFYLFDIEGPIICYSIARLKDLFCRAGHIHFIFSFFSQQETLSCYLVQPYSTTCSQAFYLTDTVNTIEIINMHTTTHRCCQFDCLWENSK